MPSSKPKTIIHVNQHVIRSNKKKGEQQPVLTVKTGTDNTYAHEVYIDGPCRVIYRPDKPLSCGARVWIETTGEVTTKRFSSAGNAEGEEKGTTDGKLENCKS